MFPPALRFLHEAETLNGVKLDYFRRVSITGLRASLAPGQEGALKTHSDGTVLDGHHRLQILLERGQDINDLPREIIERDQDDT